MSYYRPFPSFVGGLNIPPGTPLLDENPNYIPVSPAVAMIEKAAHPNLNMEMMAVSMTSFTPTPIPEMRTPPTPSRKQRSAASDEEVRSERVLQALADMEDRLRKNLESIRTDVDEIRRRLDEMAATVGTKDADSKRYTEVIQQDIAQGVNLLAGLLGKQRSKVSHAKTILDGLLN